MSEILPEKYTACGTQIPCLKTTVVPNLKYKKGKGGGFTNTDLFCLETTFT